MTASLQIRGVTKLLGSLVALSDVSISIEAGQFAVLLGPSGCGKSTLLLGLGGFLAPTRGQVWPDKILLAHLPQSMNVARGELMRLRVDPARLVALPSAE